jgi:hypothetical protein
MLTDDQIVEIAGQKAANPTQQKVAEAAIREAMGLVADVTVRANVADVPTLVAPTHSMNLFVAGALETSQTEYRSISGRLDGALAYARSLGGSGVDIITFGASRGAEEVARKWAVAHAMPHREFAVLWGLPNADGTTVQNPNAIRQRNGNLFRYLKAVENPWALLFGTKGSPGYQNALIVFEQLVKQGAKDPSKGIPVAQEAIAESEEPEVVVPDDLPENPVEAL